MDDLQRYLAEEFVEDYQAGRLSRRQALKLIASITGSLILAQTFLVSCAPPAQTTVTPEATNPSGASPTAQTATEASNTPAASAAPVSGTVNPDDPAIEAGPIEFPGEGAMLMGYLARPKAEGAFPVVLVCHENRGLTDHIRDVTRRFAKAGYVSLAVDLLSREGGTAALDASAAPGKLGSTSQDQFVQDFQSGWHYLQGQPLALADQVGMMGFCFGGGVAWRVATHLPELKAAVPFYGSPPPTEDVPRIQAAVLAIYGERDQRITQTIPTIEAAMQQSNKVFDKVIYPGADHAFFNDTGSRYNAPAAQDAWARTLDWFGRYLVSS